MTVAPVGGARSELALALTRRYVRYRFRRSFDGSFVAGLNRMRALSKVGPLIVAANHVAWWDALFILALDQQIGSESYCYMDASNLQRLPFFGWWGAIALDRSSPRKSLHDLDAGAALLDRPGRLLWIFPQGRQRPAHLRPLGLECGVRRLAARTRLPIVPLALNYLFREQPQPTAVAVFGKSIESPRRVVMKELERALCHGLDRIDRFVLGDDCDGFEQLTAPRVRSSVPRSGRLLAATMSERKTDSRHA